MKYGRPNGLPYALRPLSLNTVIEKEYYQPGVTPLHRLDPRIKVLFCLMMIVLVFTAASLAQLLVLTSVVSMALWSVPKFNSSIWSLCWKLRWLLLFTFLLHLMLSPGRTLFGVGWLSLDGLLMGLFVCGQIVLAIVLSALLAKTSSTNSIVRTFDWFVSPLKWFGCKTDEWQKVLLITMDFVPLVREEIQVSTGNDEGNPKTRNYLSTDQWSPWSHKLTSLFLRLVDRCDKVAHQMVVDDTIFLLPKPLTPLFPLALLDQLFFLIGLLLIVIYWFVG